MSQEGKDFDPSDEYEGDEAWKQRVSGLEKELFGGSSSSSEGEEEIAPQEIESEQVTMDEQQIMEDIRQHSDQTDLIKPPRKKRAKRRGEEPERQPQEQEMDEGTRRKLEARQEFEAALQKIKAKRTPKMLDSESTEFDDLAQTLKEQMIEAADSDNKSIALKQPALAKLKLMPQVSSLLAKRHLSDVLLDNGILESIRRWLEPSRTTGMLPTASLRISLLRSLKLLPIELVHLRESGLGRIVMFYARPPRAVQAALSSDPPELQKLAKELVTLWTKPYTSRRGEGSVTSPPSVLQSDTLKQRNNPNTTRLSDSQQRLISRLAKK